MVGTSYIVHLQNSGTERLTGVLEREGKGHGRVCRYSVHASFFRRLNKTSAAVPRTTVVIKEPRSCERATRLVSFEPRAK